MKAAASPHPPVSRGGLAVLIIRRAKVRLLPGPLDRGAPRACDREGSRVRLSRARPNGFGSETVRALGRDDDARAPEAARAIRTRNSPPRHPPGGHRSRVAG